MPARGSAIEKRLQPAAIVGHELRLVSQQLEDRQHHAPRRAVANLAISRNDLEKLLESRLELTLCDVVLGELEARVGIAGIFCYALSQRLARRERCGRAQARYARIERSPARLVPGVGAGGGELGLRFREPCRIAACAR